MIYLIVDIIKDGKNSKVLIDKCKGKWGKMKRTKKL
jgi:hypothetical protein